MTKRCSTRKRKTGDRKLSRFIRTNLISDYEKYKRYVPKTVRERVAETIMKASFDRWEFGRPYSTYSPMMGIGITA